MTLREALDVLHRAGRIQSISSIGMAWSDPMAPDDVWVDIDALGDPPTGHQPVLSAASTAGCLMAFAREARRDPALWAQPHLEGERDMEDVVEWSVQAPAVYGSRDIAWGPTEAAAWAAAIISAAWRTGGVR